MLQVQRNLRLDFIFSKIGRQLHPLQISLRHPFHPDRLPDSGCLHVPAGKILLHPALLAARLLPAEGILHADDNAIFSGTDAVCDVEGKPLIAAPVASRLLPVDPDRGLEITALKMKKQPLSVHSGLLSIVLLRGIFRAVLLPVSLLRRISCDGKALFIPHAGMHRLVPDAACSGLIGKRNLDFPDSVPRKSEGRPVRLALPVVIEAKAPCSVQIDPLLPDKLGSWVIRNITCCSINLIQRSLSSCCRSRYNVTISYGRTHSVTCPSGFSFIVSSILTRKTRKFSAKRRLTFCCLPHAS